MSDDKPVSPLEGHSSPLGKHPIGTGMGGLAGAVVAGAAVGSGAGPVGTVVGAVIGAAAGALTGHAFAELIDPESEDAYWREQWTAKADLSGQRDYDQDISPAYRYGVSAYNRNPEQHFNDLEESLAAGWDAARGESRLDWADARVASMDAWIRARDLAHRAKE